MIAGGVPSGGRFHLVDWDGTSQDVETLTAFVPGEFNPEAILQVDDRWLVLSDDPALTPPHQVDCDLTRGWLCLMTSSLG